MYRPDPDEKDEYPSPPCSTGNSLWIQRKEAFFSEHPDIDETELHDVDECRSSLEFQAWIESRFSPITVGQYGPTEDLCFMVEDYVMWVDITMVSRVSDSSRLCSHDMPGCVKGADILDNRLRLLRFLRRPHLLSLALKVPTFKKPVKLYYDMDGSGILRDDEQVAYSAI
jgi:hypothetical protein